MATFLKQLEDLLEKKQFRQVIDLCTVKSESADPKQLLYEGIAHAALSNFETAEKLFNKSYEQDPDDLSALLNLGICQYKSENFEQSVSTFQKLTNLRSDNHLVWRYLGLSLQKCLKHQEAIDALEKSLNLKPDFETSGYIAVSLFEAGKQRESLALFRELILKDSKSIDLTLNYAKCLLSAGEPDEAYQRLLRLYETNQGNHVIEFNLGLALLDSEIYEKSRFFFERSANLQSLREKSFINIALSFEYEKKFDLAEQYYDIASFNGSPHAKYLKSLLLLKQNKFENAWHLYENRWSVSELAYSRKNKLEKLSSKKSLIFVTKDQGVGDQILFSGWLNFLSKNYNLYAVEIDARIKHSMQRAMPEINFVSEEKIRNLNEKISRISICSLGQLIDISEKNIKLIRLYSDQPKTARFKSMILDKKKLVCGVSCSSQSRIIGKSKSIDLKLLLNVFNGLPIQLLNADPFKAGVIGSSFSQIAQPTFDPYNDLDSLVSWIDCCDLIITISNTTAHIAAGLGKYTILLCPYSKGVLWYWGHTGQRSPWYLNLTILRQKIQGNWVDPLNQLRLILKSRLADSSL